jgi:hypothetical protein
VNVADVFSNTTDVTTVWKWIPATSKWAFYSPALADGGAAYAASKGYDPLVTINNGDGFWVNAKTSFAATILGTCTAPQVLTNGVCTTPTAPAPAVAMAISKPKTTVGTSVTVSWSSSNAKSCVGLDGMSGAKAINNSEAVMPTAGGQYTYTISCDGDGGTAKASVSLVVPIPVQATSYLNAKNLNIPAQKYPILPMASPTMGTGFTGGVAYADFFGEGKISMVGFSNIWAPDGNNPAGKVYFYKFDANGNPVDHTADLLEDVTGCEAPRKLLVADFNGDGKPDVYASCTGKEFPFTGQWPGEQTRVLLSQPDGTYKNEATGLNCYCHTSAAADLNGDGKVDIITSDWLIHNPAGTNPMDPQPSSVLVLTNDGTGHFTIKQDSNFAVVPEIRMVDTVYGYVYPSNNGMATIELVDINGDGMSDLIVGSGMDTTDRFYVPHHIMTNNGNGTFTDYATFRTGKYTDYWALDIIVKGSDVYMYGADSNGITYTNLIVAKYDISSKALTTVWESKGKTWPQVVISPTDFDWMMPYNGNLVPYNAAYGESIPMQ